MTCPHATTTVVAHLFGEAPADYADHLAACDACQRALVAHADTLDLVAPVLAASAVAPTVLPAPANRPSWLRLMPAAALAAAVALFVAAPLPTRPPSPLAGEVAFDTIDAELALLDLELTALEADFTLDPLDAP